MSTFIDRDKVAKLPVWAQELIRRLELANEPLIEQAVKYRREATTASERAKRLSESNEALMEILRAAGRGGSDWADMVVRTLEGYSIFRDGDKGE